MKNKLDYGDIVDIKIAIYSKNIEYRDQMNYWIIENAIHPSKKNKENIEFYKKLAEKYEKLEKKIDGIK